MPPTGGEGGNTAIHDAELLMKRLTNVMSAADRGAALHMEIEEYEKEMLQFSKSSAGRSYRNSALITIEGYIIPYLFRTFLRVMNFFFGARKS